jgi:predicted transcriptional regulator
MLADSSNNKSKQIISSRNSVRMSAVVSLMFTHKVGAVAITGAAGKIVSIIEEKGIINGCAKYGPCFLE